MKYNHQEAILALVEHDISKWGEQERAASLEMRSKLSHGLALNALLNIQTDLGEIPPDPELGSQVKETLSNQDWKFLNSGG